jgi:hypothetical protein
MKTWLDTFRISAALDAGQPLPPALAQRVAHSDALRQFAERAAHLDQSLKKARPQTAVPAELHESIMRQVCAVRRPVTPARSPWPRWRWLAAPALAALALTAVWWTLNRPTSLTPPRFVGVGPPLASGMAALEWGEALTRRVPEEVLSPLSEEMTRLEQDLNRSAEFLMASLP